MVAREGNGGGTGGTVKGNKRNKLPVIKQVSSGGVMHSTSHTIAMALHDDGGLLDLGCGYTVSL